MQEQQKISRRRFLTWAGGAVGAGGYIGERGLEHLVLGRDLGRDAWAELGNGAGDVGAREEWAVVRVAVLVVEIVLQ